MTPLSFGTYAATVLICGAWLMTGRDNASRRNLMGREALLSGLWLSLAHVPLSSFWALMVWGGIGTCLLVPISSPDAARPRKIPWLLEVISFAMFAAGLFFHNDLAVWFYLGALWLRAGVFPFHFVNLTGSEVQQELRLYSNLHLFLALSMITHFTSGQIPYSSSLLLSGICACASVYLALSFYGRARLLEFSAYLQAWQLTILFALVFSVHTFASEVVLLFQLSLSLSIAALLIGQRILRRRWQISEVTEFLALQNFVPGLAVPYFLFTVATIFGPFTLGFVGEDLALTKIMSQSLLVGCCVILGSALIAIRLYVIYSLLFYGAAPYERATLPLKFRERLVVILLLLALLGPGLFPDVLL